MKERKKLKKRYVLMGVILTTVFLVIGSTIFQEWAMAGGDVEMATEGFRNLKNGSVAIQAFILISVWWFWDEWIVSRVPESRKSAVAGRKNGTCATVAVMLFLIWLT